MRTLPQDSSHDPESHHRPAADNRHTKNPDASLLQGTLIPLLVGLLIGSIFVAVYLAAFHDPKPHKLSVAVIAPSALMTSLEQQSAKNDEAFAIHTYSTRSAALRAVKDHTEFGAFIVQPSGAELVVAGANGFSVTQTLEGAFGAAAKAAHLQFEVTDVSPLSTGDSRGLSVFYGAFGVVLAAFLFGLTSMQTGPALPVAWRAASAVAFAAVAGLVVAWLLGPVFGTLPAPFALTAAIVGLLALAVGTTTAGLLRIFGAAGTFIASIVLLVFGNATSTGILPAQYLPAWLEALTPILPVGVAVRALRGGAYFNDDGVLSGVFVLLAWIFGAAAIFVAGTVMHSRRNAAKEN